MEATKGDLRPIENNKNSITGTRCRWLWTRNMGGRFFDDKKIDWIAGKSPSCGFQVLAPHSSSRTNPVQLTHAGIYI
ncbi:hypothetical protein IFM47457_04535 [Aspergillus lentulus]|nr:hypothetical protein IFM47457_04535 [Aspergillus lentulus]